MSLIKSTTIIFILLVFTIACGRDPQIQQTNNEKEPQRNPSSSTIDQLIDAKKLIVKKYDESNIPEHAQFNDLVKQVNEKIDSGGGLLPAGVPPTAVTFGLFLSNELIGTAWFLSDGLGSIVIDRRQQGKGFGKFLFIQAMTESFEKYNELTLRNDAKELGDHIYGTFGKQFFKTSLTEGNKYTHKLYNKEYYEKKLKEPVKERWWLRIYQKLISKQ